jgi:group I intron endonuclease
MGIIYCLTSPSGKKYIGQTTRTFDKRFDEHCKRKDCIFLYNAIQKYTPEKIQKEILLICEDEFLDVYETKFIETLDTLYPNGYNIRTGGSAGLHCDASKEKMRQSKLGEKNHNFGKSRTDETKKRISEMKKGVLHHFYGKELSIEHKQNLSKAHKKGDDIPMYIVKLKARPKVYQSSGYLVINHPDLKTRYFTSKKLSDEEKYNMALDYLLNSCDKNAVQRLNGSG